MTLFRFLSLFLVLIACLLYLNPLNGYFSRVRAFIIRKVSVHTKHPKWQSYLRQDSMSKANSGRRNGRSLLFRG